ncbi:hypothetical protein LVJ84_09695 [Kingella potus]|nr:hypothetical protein LVJ84_09695 [Kingella potus]
MFPFARLLEKQGFAVETFGYYSVWQTHERHTAALADTVCGFFRRHPDTPLHLVGHSLGGLVLRRFAAAHPDLVRGTASLPSARRTAAVRRPKPSAHGARACRCWAGHTGKCSTATCRPCPQAWSWAALRAANRWAWGGFSACTGQTTARWRWPKPVSTAWPATSYCLFRIRGCWPTKARRRRRRLFCGTGGLRRKRPSETAALLSDGLKTPYHPHCFF